MKLNWQKVILYFTAMGMDCCWLYILLAVINRLAAGGRLYVAGMLTLYPISFILNKLRKGTIVP